MPESEHDPRSGPKVSVLVPDAAANCLGPATVMGKIFARHYPVEIVAPDIGAGVNPMYRDSFDYTIVPTPRLYRIPDYFSGIRQLGRAISGDVIFAVKAFADTLPVALQEKRRRGCKVLLYLDEWDGALYEAKSAGEKMRNWLQHWHHPMEDCWLPHVERRIAQVDMVLSTNTFLQKKFGGRLLHFGVDCEVFKPQPEAETQSLRQQLGLTAHTLIVFGGVVRPHKGVETILEALVMLNDSKLKLVVAGPRSAHLEMLLANPAYEPYLHCTGAVPKEDMPRYLGLADLMVIPLADTLLSRSQMPCKTYEAMAMGKPIVGTGVSDLPFALDGCGWITTPGDAEKLAAAIGEVVADPAKARAIGEAARKKCLAEYSLEQTEKTLLDVMGEMA